MVTSAAGCVLSFTVNVAVPPASVVVSPAVGVTVIPATSLSVFETDVGCIHPVVLGSVLVAAAVTIVSDRAVHLRIVHAGYRHGLRHIPVHAREDEGGSPG